MYETDDEKINEIFNLLDRKQLGDEERKRLLTLIDEDPVKAFAAISSGRYMRRLKEILPASSPHAKKLLGYLHNRLQMDTPEEKVYPMAQRPSVWKSAWIRKMAAAAVILGLGFYFYPTPNKNGSEGLSIIPSDIKNDIQPGGNKAILALADGSTIVLDNGENGQLVDVAGFRIVKSAEGELTYEQNQHSATQNLTQSYHTIQTPRGGQYKLKLPDGTIVWMNAASSLRFPVQYNEQERRVFLEGEAYFEVAPHTKWPFIVSSPQSTTKVLGTKFNISAYREDAESKTTLAEGAVEVVQTSSQTHSALPVILSPGEQAVVSTHNEKISVSKTDVEAALAWTNAMFVFKSESLDKIMLKLSRWYDVEVSYDEHLNKNLRFTGRIGSQNNISDILRILEITKKVKFSIQGKSLKVMPYNAQ